MTHAQRRAGALAAGLLLGLWPLLPFRADADVSREQQLYEACVRNDLMAAKSLLRDGANPNTYTEKGETPFQAAVVNGNRELVEALLDAGVYLNSPLRNGYYGLQYAILYSNQGLNRLAGALAGRNPLGGAHEAIVRLLLDRGADPNGAPPGTSPPLMLAALAGNSTVVELLLDRGADPEVIAPDGTTSLHVAAALGHPQVVRLLLQRRVRVQAMTDQGATPLQLAAACGDPALVRLGDAEEALLSEKVAGAARGRGHADICQALLARGANPNAGDFKGETPLMIAAAAGDTQILLDLLTWGARIEARDGEGATALMHAAARGKTEAVRFLLGRKADPRAVNRNRETALALARRGGHAQAAALLERAAGPLEPPKRPLPRFPG